MTKVLLLRLHRWTSLVFALPLLVIIATGLILSFEPLWQVSGIKPHSIDAAKVVDMIGRYDPEGKARGVSIRSADGRIALQGTTTQDIDLASGEPAARPMLADIFLWARFTHERLLGLPWLVSASTVAMLTIMALGIGMGWPRLRNTLSGWHKGAAWFTLPLILLSPLTGLCLAFGLTFQGGAPPAAPGGRPMTLTDAVRAVAQSQDLSQAVSIGVRGGRTMARLYDGGELRTYAVSAAGLTALPRNWPRLIHEGNWSAAIASSGNLLVSVVLMTLLSTGVLIWARRKLRQPRGRANDPDSRPVSPQSLAA